MTDSNVGKDEFAFIEQMTKLFSSYRKEQVIVPNGDDAAIYLPQRAALGQVVAVDTMVEGIHFTRKTMSPYDIGYKSVAINLSDMAAMGAVPAYFLVSIAVPKAWQEEDLLQIFKGMHSLAEEYRLDLLGGDTVSSPDSLVITVTVIGEIEPGKPLRRSYATPGQLIFVTGQIGTSAAGLHYLLHQQEQSDIEREPLQKLIKRHQQPDPHLLQGQIIADVGTGKNISLNDISDGLASEASEIATSSGVNLIINKDQLPLDSALIHFAQASGEDPYQWIYNGGEDFVLIGTCPEELAPVLEQKFREQSLELYFIGHVEQGTGEVYVVEDGQRAPLLKKGYNHFSSR